ncbi:S1 family serine peptidase [Zobellia nedashkovskayae]|uniref:S1 family serine peptidase n=1 Tax=Zobellia nedashkovskayae TaxID=2779510 RepID=UPI00188C01F9|nr:serine protease [Zobellia nedashkovskayae]
MIIKRLRWRTTLIILLALTLFIFCFRACVTYWQEEEGTRGIRGGVEASENEFPYQIAIVSKQRKKEAYCGGVIINSEWILTAAHCFDNVNKDNYLVYSGNGKLNSSGKYSDILNVFSFEGINPYNGQLEKYDSGGYQHDILLIQLKKRLEISSKTKTIRPISSSLLKQVIENKQSAMMVGWGKTNSLFRPERLMEKPLPLISKLNCQSEKNIKGYIKDGMICIGEKNVVSACNGDSGNGVYYFSIEGAKLVGITTIGSNSCNMDIKHLEYDVLMDITFYSDWITLVIQSKSNYNNAIS